MTDTDLIQLVRDAVRDAMRDMAQPTPAKSILTRAEAMIYVGRKSHAAFSAWCARWQVRAECRGRWSRTRLDLALAREAGAAHIPASLRK